MYQYILFWGIAIVVFAIIEALTAGLASIWFSIGAIAGLIAAICGAPVPVQGLLFLIVSGVCFVFIRSRAVKNMKNNFSKTDIDRIIGSEVIITETVDNKHNSGKAEINDVEWKVKSTSGEIINPGEAVTVEKIEGVKLLVKKQ